MRKLRKRGKTVRQKRGEIMAKLRALYEEQKQVVWHYLVLEIEKK